MSELTQKGIQALKAGDRSSARGLLAAAVKQDPNDAQAWLWLTGALDNDEERLACLRQVLRIDPANQPAARGLAQIMERRKRVAPPASDTAPAGVEAAEAVESETAPAAGETPAPPPAPETAPEQAGAPAPSAMVEDNTAAAAGAAALESKPPAARRRKRAAQSEESRRIFHTRPSLVPALACFWLFVLGPVVILVLLPTPEGRILAAVVGVLLLLIDFYVIISTLGTHYELTNQQLRLRSGRDKISVDISDIYAVEVRQSGLQKLFGLGDIEIDTAANDRLTHMRLRNISNVKMRGEQIQYLTQAQV